MQACCCFISTFFKNCCGGARLQFQSKPLHGQLMVKSDGLMFSASNVQMVNCWEQKEKPFRVIDHAIFSLLFSAVVSSHGLPTSRQLRQLSTSRTRNFDNLADFGHLLFNPFLPIFNYFCSKYMKNRFLMILMLPQKDGKFQIRKRFWREFSPEFSA